MPARPIPTETGHATASINGQTLANATTWLRCEGNIYFPPDSLVDKDKGVFSHTELMTYCPWKGHAGYYSVEVGGKRIENAAWYYEDPFDAAKSIKNYVAFDKSKVTIEVDQ